MNTQQSRTQSGSGIAQAVADSDSAAVATFFEAYEGY